MSAPPPGVWCVLSDERAEDLPHRGAAALAAGAAALTLRRPASADGAVAAAWRDPRLARAWRAVHARADLALATGSAAVISGARGLPLADSLAAFPRLAHGASVHGPEEARAARDAGAAFLLFGPVWETPEKRGVLAARGPGALADACALGLPVVAIGGVLAPEQVRAARAAGVHAVAVLRAAREPERLAALVSAFAG